MGQNMLETFINPGCALSIARENIGGESSFAVYRNGQIVHRSPSHADAQDFYDAQLRQAPRPAIQKQKVAPLAFYAVRFRTYVDRVKSNWHTVDDDVPTTFAECAEQIGEFCQERADDISVIYVNLRSGTVADVTDEALREFGRISAERTGQWPDWLADMGEIKAETPMPAAISHMSGLTQRLVSDYLTQGGA
jgi:hypothetical protein